MTQKKRGRKPGSKNKPKVSPLVEEKFEQALDNAAKESGIKPKGIVELMDEGMRHLLPELELIDMASKAMGGKGIDPNSAFQNRKEKVVIVDEQTPFPEGWEKMSKTEKLKFFTANRK